MKLKIAIIGCGAMGKYHARQWQSRDDAKVAAVFDPVAGARDALAKEMSAPAYDNFRGAIDHKGIDAVSICTPMPFHREIACYAAQRGRHILCEKPIAGTIEDADAMIDAAERHGAWLTIGHQYREWPRNKRIKELYDGGSLGSPLMARYETVAEVRPKTAMHRMSMNQGPVLDLSAHWFDLMRFFTGAELVSVYASANVFGRGKPRLAQVADDDFAPDAAEVQARFEGGHVLSIGVIWGMPEGFPGFGREQIVGPKGVVHAQDAQTEVLLGRDQRETVPPTGGEPAPRIADLVNAIRTGTPPRVTGRDGREAVRGCLAALESIRSGKVVELSVPKVG